MSATVSIPMFFKEDNEYGRVICLNDEQSLKAHDPILFTDDGIIIFSNEEQP